MPKRTNFFQTLVKRIESAYLKDEGAEVTESAMIPNYVTGHETEVDILISFRIGQRTYRTAIECRDHKRRQGPDWIGALESKKRECRLDKIVAVSSSGFTSSVKQQSPQYGIETIHVQVDTDFDKVARIARQFQVMLTGASSRLISHGALAVTCPIHDRPCSGGSPVKRLTLGEETTDANQLLDELRGHVNNMFTPVFEAGVARALPEAFHRSRLLDFVVEFPYGTTAECENGDVVEIIQLSGLLVVDSFVEWADSSQIQYGPAKLEQHVTSVDGLQLSMMFDVTQNRRMLDVQANPPVNIAISAPGQAADRPILAKCTLWIRDLCGAPLAVQRRRRAT
jgi:hypothetical protein